MQRIHSRLRLAAGLAVLTAVTFVAPVRAQTAAGWPAWPAAGYAAQSAGLTGSVGATIQPGHLLLSTMHSDRLAGKTETFLRYGVNRRLELGFGYLWEQGIVRPLASYTLLTETKQRPALTAGLFFDALGGGREAVHVSASRNLRPLLGKPSSGYLGLARITNEEGLRVIAGTSVALSQRLNASVQYDGKFVHLGLTRQMGSIGDTPVFLGLVVSGSDAVGPIAAADMPLTRRP